MSACASKIKADTIMLLHYEASFIMHINNFIAVVLDELTTGCDCCTTSQRNGRRSC